MIEGLLSRYTVNHRLADKPNNLVTPTVTRTPVYYPPPPPSTIRTPHYGVFSLTWRPASMQIYWNKRKCLHKKGVQLPGDLFGTQTKWPSRLTANANACILICVTGRWTLHTMSVCFIHGRVGGEVSLFKIQLNNWPCRFGKEPNGCILHTTSAMGGSFHCFGTPIWPPWLHGLYVKTLYYGLCKPTCHYNHTDITDTPLLQSPR